MRKSILAVVVSAVALMAGPASAQYPPLAFEIAISDVAVQCPGDTLTVSGSGATPGGEIAVLFDGDVVATTTANAAGEFSVTFDVPAAAPGEHLVTAVDLETGRTASATVVCPAVAAVPVAPVVPGLAVTGGNIAVWMVMLAGLLLIGGTALVMGRRRARRA